MTNKTFDIFGYNFPHWKTQQGLLNLCANGVKINTVVLQDRKVLNVPESKYKFTPTHEYIQDPKSVCNALGLKYTVCDHDSYNKFEDLPFSDAEYAIILGARILKPETVKKYKGIINIHPGILPGNRGLDNLKWCFINNLPVGVTAHFIDHRIDMGSIIMTENVKLSANDTIESVYLKQRNLEQKVLIYALKLIDQPDYKLTHCEFSTKFSAVPDYIDKHIKTYFYEYIGMLPDLRQPSL